jgi:predicted NBD/HSP70 family sugar kinase
MSSAVGDATVASIFMTVLTKGPIARSEIATELGLSPGTISRAVRPLLDSGYLSEDGLSEDGAGSLSRPGRPVVPLRVVADREFVVGIKLAGDHVVGVVVDLLANVRASREVALEDASVSVVVAAVSDLVGQLRDAVGGRVTRIGIGVGGHVEPATQMVRYAPFLGWRDVALAELVSAATGLPVMVENDVNSLTVAEQWFGAGVDVASFAVVTIGAGIGCGLVIAGTLVHGAVGLAGELGHVPISADGPRCRCGNSGCIETTASENAILSRVRAASRRDDLDITAAVALARAGDQAAVAAFTAAGNALGRALAVVANLVNPHRIVLSGEGLGQRPVSKALHERRSPPTRSTGRRVRAHHRVARPHLGKGAAAVAIQHLFLGPMSGNGR